jgi:hypothetical protein
MSTVDRVSNDELLAALSGPEPSRVFDFERRRADGTRVASKIRVRLLKSASNIAAVEAAQAFAKGRDLKDYGDVYREAQVHEVLARAVCREDLQEVNGARQHSPLFMDAAHLRERLSEPEISYLWSCYHLVRDEFGPVGGLDACDAEGWIRRLSGPMGADFLAGLDSAHWPGLIFMLAAVSQELLSSDGPPPSSSPAGSASTTETSTSDTGSSTGQPAESPTVSRHVDIWSPEQIEDQARRVRRRNATDL